MIRFATIMLLTVISLSLTAQSNSEVLKFSNLYPEATQRLGFTFNKTRSSLIDEKNINIEIYEFNEGDKIVKEPKLLKKGELYSGSFIIDSNTHVIVFYIFGDKEVDDNFGEGYFMPIYKNKKLIKPYYKTQAELYSFYGEYNFNLPRSHQKSLQLLEQGLKTFPDFNEDAGYYESYINAISKVDQINSSNNEAAIINAIEKRTNISNGFYGILENYYIKLNNKAKSDSLLVVEKQKFPNGDWTIRNLYIDFVREKNSEKKAAMYEIFVSKQKPNKGSIQFQGILKKAIAAAYANEGNTVMATKWNSGVPMNLKMADLNNKSWALAEAGKDLQTAKKMSAEATLYAKQQFENPAEKEDDAMSTRTWKRELENTYAMYADTYAFILYQLGEYNDGMPFAKAAATIAKFQNAEYNERYAMYLQKTGLLTNAKNILEDMVVLNSASAKTKNVLKELYIERQKTENGFDSYIASLEEKNKNEKKLEIAKAMFKKPSPKFMLKDWDGNEVSLESLKGKIVVLDFWATWCGPCIASMPGMQKAQEKLAARKDVQFLFIDTKENADNKLENAKEFMKKKNYPFYVLMDNDNKMSSAFDVNGIPVKFVLDKNGNIRFKSVGYGGNADELAEEVLQMVEMAGK